MTTFNTISIFYVRIRCVIIDFFYYYVIINEQYTIIRRCRGFDKYSLLYNFIKSVSSWFNTLLSLLSQDEYARDPNTRLNWLSFLPADGQELHVRQRVLRGRKQHPAARRSAPKGVQPRGVERRRRTKRDADATQDSYHARYTNARVSLSLSLSLSFVSLSLFLSLSLSFFLIFCHARSRNRQAAIQTQTRPDTSDPRRSKIAALLFVDLLWEIFNVWFASRFNWNKHRLGIIA